ncbi:MAG: 4Fe-4S dicluster domain-containing protein [Eggerthellaceae bacterium]|nr:4Fe-4S dicluster domain-containing protein [Eggerthellaceae bacterium]
MRVNIPGVAAALLAGAALLKSAVDLVGPSKPLFPPGAWPEDDFAAKCIKCGKCFEACPYQAIHAAGSDAGAMTGAPSIDAREQACRLCADFPCIEACPTGALSPVESKADVRMGTAVINEETCLSFMGMRCEVCYRACPLIDEAITIDYRQREGDALHAVFAPIINEDSCVGRGLCVERCVVSDPEPAIRIEAYRGSQV